MNTGWDKRLAILRGDVEQKVLVPLRAHSWTIHGVHDVESGEYVLVDVERAEQRHKIAVMYTSATRNEVYKSLAGQVEHIFIHGQLYHLESYAYGISTPIDVLDNFHSLLLKWNAATAPGKFAPGPPPRVEAGPPKERRLLAEIPIDAVWLRLRQLTSVTLARKLIEGRARTAEASLERSSVDAKAEGVAFALRNAADYFHLGREPNISQRVLNLYYGAMSFAFAEMLADPNGPHTLGQIEESTKQGHGLCTLDGEQEGLGKIVVGVLATGFFPTWMRSQGIATDRFPRQKAKAFADLTKQPDETWVTIERLFARIPEVADLFSDIFDSKPAWVTPTYDESTNQRPSFFRATKETPATTTYALLLDDSARMSPEDIAALPGPISQIVEVPAKGSGRHFRVAVEHTGKAVWWDALPLHRSPFERTALVMPLFGTVGEYRAICVVLLYALSIVVRYRPSIWRRVQEGDLDHLRVLIEAFLAVVERVLPEQFLERVTGQRVFVKQPGSFF